MSKCSLSSRQIHQTRGRPKDHGKEENEEEEKNIPFPRRNSSKIDATQVIDACLAVCYTEALQCEITPPLRHDDSSGGLVVFVYGISIVLRYQYFCSGAS